MTRRTRLVAGVDTHADTHHVAVIDELGRPVTDRQFAATAAGYRRIMAFLGGCGEVVAVGVEGTGKAKTMGINQIKAVLVAADDNLRARYRGLTNKEMLQAMTRTRPGGPVHSAARATAVCLKILATRRQSLSAEIAVLDAQLDELTDLHAPGLKAVHGVGAETAAQLLITAGDNPA